MGFVPDFNYMKKYIEELEQYLVVTGLNDYKLTDKDIEYLSLVSGITKNEIVKMLLEFAKN